MKKLFGLLTFILIGLINFGYCSDITITDGFEGSYHSTNAFYNDLYGVDTDNIYKFCISNNSSNNIEIWYGAYGMSMRGGYSYPVCFALDNTIQSISVITTNSYSIYTVEFMQISKFNSLNCQTEFSLIPLSSVDQNYCVTNGLCPSSPDVECPGSGDNWSALYINNIQHLGKPIINVTIPDYIFWDYETDDDVFNLYVGSGYDQDYIDSVISINSYRPDTSDFTDIFVSGLTLIMPYIVILLFIVFIRKFIKRIFK